MDLHCFELNSLLNLDLKYWIINKDKPNIPILKIDENEMNLIQSGIYKKDNIVIKYNDNEYQISKDMFEKVKRKSGLKNLDVSQLGISYAEYFNEDVINKTKLTLMLYNIKHLKDSNTKIVIVSDKSNRKRYAHVLNVLRKELNSRGLDIWKIYFTANKINVRYNNEYGADQVKLVLEHLIGLKIDDYKFIPIKQDKFENVYYYSNEINNTHFINDIQSYFNDILKNTDDEMFEYVNDRLKNNVLTVYNNYVGSNKINPFTTAKIVLAEQTKFAIRKVQENFKIIKNFDEF